MSFLKELFLTQSFNTVYHRHQRISISKAKEKYPRVTVVTIHSPALCRI